MMNNAELALAITVTQERLHKTGTAYAEHGMLVEHLRKLLLEQITRANARAPKPAPVEPTPSIGEFSALMPCSCIGGNCQLAASCAGVMAANYYCKQARAGVSSSVGSTGDASAVSNK